MQLEYVSPSNIKIPAALLGVIQDITEYEPGKGKVCLLGIEEYRGHKANRGCESAPDKIREQLFKLKKFPSGMVIDAGNIKMGATYNDSDYALEQTVHDILSMNLIPIILGGDKSLLNAQEKAYHLLNSSYLNLIHIDERFELGQDIEELINENNYLDIILKREPNLLFNFTQLGYQSYFTDDISIDIIKKMDFECYRLGKIRSDIKEVEPVVRDGDLMAFNIAALCHLDGQGYYQPSPNGFNAVETCQIFRYAGLSDRLTSLGIYDYNPTYDNNNITAQVMAQAIWYFIKGVSDRKKDYPVVDDRQFNKYVVNSNELGYDITFLKSVKSDRWWIRIPDEFVKYKSHQLFPCSYRDYQLALKDEIPERWWKAYKKLV